MAENDKRRPATHGAPPKKSVATNLDTSIVGQNLNGSAHVAPFVTGLDGKLYPRSPMDSQTRLALIVRVHELAHRGLSVRRIVDTLAQSGLRRSVGSVASYLGLWRCAECSGDPNAAPEQAGGAA